MATGLEIVPDTAKALSAPVTKLIEVVAAGCGRLYGPTDIKRTAAAQGEALVIMETAKLRAEEVAIRAANRVLDVEIKRQENIEAITQIAQEQLPLEVSDEPVDTGWTTRFFREAQDVSNDQMRLLWGKLLAGEVAKPGSFSQRTLSVIANLSHAEANLFEKICALSSKVTGAPPMAFINDTKSAALQQQGITFFNILQLQNAGLITFEPLGTILNFESPAGAVISTLIERPGGISFIAHHPAPRATIRAGTVSFTEAGAELLGIEEWELTPDHDKNIFDALVSQGWTVVRQKSTRELGGIVGRMYPFPDSEKSETVS